MNRTDLDGEYDLELRWTVLQASADAAPPGDAPSLFTALQEQLGLKLVPEKALMDVLIVDRVERPSGN